jgi:hypothetical protein
MYDSVVVHPSIHNTNSVPVLDDYQKKQGDKPVTVIREVLRVYNRGWVSKESRS